jgi:hypothetical protein
LFYIDGQRIFPERVTIKQEPEVDERTGECGKKVPRRRHSKDRGHKVDCTGQGQGTAKRLRL